MPFPIFKLPPEVVKCIFDQMDSSFFHQDLGCLAISKEWFDYAHPATLRRLTLSPQNLPGLIASGAHIAELHPLKRSLEVLELGVGGMQTGEKETLEDELTQLAQILGESRKLRAVNVQSRHLFFNDGPFASVEHSGPLLLPVMRVLFSAENLNTLKLDLHGVDEDHHLCPDISNTLDALRTLHLRMSTICPDCVKPPNSKDHLRLRTVVVNIRHATNDAGPLVARHSKRCGPRGNHEEAPSRLKALKQEMKEQLEALAKKMSSPKTVRLLSFPGLTPITRPEPSTKGISRPDQTLSYDVLAGNAMVLDHDMAWEADGEILEDDEVLSDDDGLPSSQDELSDYFDTYLDDSDSS